MQDADNRTAPSAFWFAILSQKLGEVAAAYLNSAIVEADHVKVRLKLIELSAIVVRFIEALDQGALFATGETP